MVIFLALVVVEEITATASSVSTKTITFDYTIMNVLLSVLRG
jgi:hypothetical protein